MLRQFLLTELGKKSSCALAPEINSIHTGATLIFINLACPVTCYYADEIAQHNHQYHDTTTAKTVKFFNV